ncbi:Hpt domain-containing protein [Jannaschia sp. 2305UL9-9]|uniref:Hpt domain-containing protein n=1 Tax=Jannaschia sp. 2305UL9-9 TaxID=3121638 RepID=UPI0035273788
MMDTARIEELRQEIGEDDLSLVLGIFAAEAEEVIARIGAGLSEAELGQAVHFLRSSALNIGFTALADQADSAVRLSEQAQSIARDLQDTLNVSMQQLGLAPPIAPSCEDPASAA